MILDTLCFSMYSDMSSLISGSTVSNISLARTLTSSVLPTPVGPTNMKDAGLRRSVSCTLVRFIAFATSSQASS